MNAYSAASRVLVGANPPIDPTPSYRGHSGMPTSVMESPLAGPANVGAWGDVETPTMASFNITPFDDPAPPLNTPSSVRSEVPTPTSRKSRPILWINTTHPTPLPDDLIGNGNEDEENDGREPEVLLYGDPYPPPPGPPPTRPLPPLPRQKLN
ncbi:hypothetical protein F4810DRAFT_705390 [Camillea tinctor]|nr:hypothetical protein F4810DRAFT_705390 [Camillea tinctor]